jgi:hypothetical protein
MFIKKYIGGQNISCSHVVRQGYSTQSESPGTEPKNEQALNLRCPESKGFWFSCSRFINRLTVAMTYNCLNFKF